MLRHILAKTHPHSGGCVFGHRSPCYVSLPCIWTHENILVLFCLDFFPFSLKFFLFLQIKKMSSASLLQMERLGFGLLSRGTLKCHTGPTQKLVSRSKISSHKSRLLEPKTKCFSTTSANNVLDIGGIYPPIPTPFVNALDDGATTEGLRLLPFMICKIIDRLLTLRICFV